jgi:Tol biopolymer transport system component
VIARRDPIAFTSDRITGPLEGKLDRGPNHISVIEADGSSRVQLTDNPTAASDPAWSPDGTVIAFRSLYGSNAGESILSFSHQQGEDGATRVTNPTVWECPRLSEPSEG